jgi:hypothetical protein
MKKLLVRIVLVLAALVVVGVLARNLIARIGIEVGTKKTTGFPLEIGTVNVGLFNGQLDVERLKLMNPPEFQDRLFVDLPSLHVKYQLGSMFTGVPHINTMVIKIDQIVLVKNTNGISNLQQLKGVVSPSESGKASGGGGQKPEATKSRPYRVDDLRIHVGTVIIKDLTKVKPSERKLTLNIDARYKDITDSTDITRLVLMTIAGQVPLPDLGIKVDDLKKGLGNAQNAAGDAVKGISDAGKSLIDKLNPPPPKKK